MFEFGDLDAEETALLALEYVRASARWLAEAAEAAELGDEEARVFQAAAVSTNDFVQQLEMSLQERFDVEEAPPHLVDRLQRRPDIESFEENDETSSQDLLEVACAEQEEALQFFVVQSEEQEEGWLRELFQEVAHHSRSVLLYLEGEREALIDREGA